MGKLKNRLQELAGISKNVENTTLTNEKFEENSPIKQLNEWNAKQAHLIHKKFDENYDDKFLESSEKNEESDFTIYEFEQKEFESNEGDEKLYSI